MVEHQHVCEALIFPNCLVTTQREKGHVTQHQSSYAVYLPLSPPLCPWNMSWCILVYIPVTCCSTSSAAGRLIFEGHLSLLPLCFLPPLPPPQPSKKAGCFLSTPLPPLSPPPQHPPIISSSPPNPSNLVFFSLPPLLPPPIWQRTHTHNAACVWVCDYLTSAHPIFISGKKRRRSRRRRKRRRKRRRRKKRRRRTPQST